MARQSKRLMVFDWDEAARLIRSQGCKRAEIGLTDFREETWDQTSSPILEDGRPVYPSGEHIHRALASTEAKPTLRLYRSGEDTRPDQSFSFWGFNQVECWHYDKYLPAHIYWPQSALDILNALSQPPAHVKTGGKNGTK